MGAEPASEGRPGLVGAPAGRDGRGRRGRGPGPAGRGGAGRGAGSPGPSGLPASARPADDSAPPGHYRQRSTRVWRARPVCAAPHAPCPTRGTPAPGDPSTTGGVSSPPPGSRSASRYCPVPLGTGPGPVGTMSGRGASARQKPELGPRRCAGPGTSVGAGAGKDRQSQPLPRQFSRQPALVCGLRICLGNESALQLSSFRSRVSDWESKTTRRSNFL